MNDNSCLVKFFDWGWRELVWNGSPIAMDQVESLLDRAQNMQDNSHLFCGASISLHM
jgi:hypothetical protein